MNKLDNKVRFDVLHNSLFQINLLIGDFFLQQLFLSKKLSLIKNGQLRFLLISQP